MRGGGRCRYWDYLLPPTVDGFVEREIYQGGEDGSCFSYATKPGTFEDVMKCLQWPGIPD